MNNLKKIISLNPLAVAMPEDDLAAEQRLRLFRTVTYISLFVCLVFLIQVAVVLPGNYPVLSLMVGLFLAGFINYIALAFHKNARAAFMVLLLVWFTLIHVDGYYSGGIKNSANCYLAVLILTAYMLLGKTGGVAAGILSILHLVYFYILSHSTGLVNNSLIGENEVLLNIYYFLSTAASMIVLSFQAAYIENSKNQIIDTVRSGRNELALKNTELLASQAALAAKINELERKNKELEQFAYVASHDLQEPLRTATGFIELLQRHYREKLDDRAVQYLSFIAESSDRMKTLIKELLDYSRIGFDEERVAIDCNQLIKEIIVDLGQSIRESDARISCGKLPVINGYAVAIRQVFQNMVLNAIKFRRPTVLPEIKIAASKENQQWHFSVADNGIGIAEEQFDRIFIIFQRLHPRSEYEGSGIGLSHCKKIIELHNGKIWVESKPGEGTIFHFTIP